ncbi:hypothetical protein NP493_119g01051 [Ridgeia piscesae]|uniref:BTB domain-containing protein n=1 Tax=Ridgeia piscesae TaxID=27915 RepID=A0AAD9P6N4_RIDPI|nr:hypothetical protein NP493_119g01051 [Ridgeia piscesae]
MSRSPRKRISSARHVSTASVDRLSLESGNYGSRILRSLSQLQSENVLCDYTLVADDLHISVHRLVMVACSDYFRAMMTGDMQESRAASVVLHGITAVGLRAVVDFAYTGRLQLQLANFEDVLSAATHLQVSEAMELCCQFLERVITVENCVSLLNIAEMFSLIRSSDKVYKFIVTHFDCLSQQGEFYNLSSTQLAELLSENDLEITSEYQIFELVQKWINFDLTQRLQYLPLLMKNVRLPLLTGEELVEKVSRVSLMTEDRVCSELLTEAKDYHIVVSKQPLLQTNRTQVRSNSKSIVMCHAENLESYSLQTERHTFLKDAPVPLYNPCVCVINNFMYVCGGKYDNTENNEIATARCFRYDPRFDSWFELASMNEARKDFVLLDCNNCLYAIGGQDENMVMCTVECFSIDKNDWEMCLSLSHAVYSHAGAVCKGSIYISGGQKFEGHCKTMLSYDAQNDMWSEAPSLLSPRCNHSMAAVADSLFVLGGNTEDSYGFPVPVTSVDMYTPSTKTWCICETSINIREAGCCIVGKHIYLIGGINDQHYYSDLIQSYDVERDRVRVIDKFPTRINGRACCTLTLPQCI